MLKRLRAWLFSPWTTIRVWRWGWHIQTGIDRLFDEGHDGMWINAGPISLHLALQVREIEGTPHKCLIILKVLIDHEWRGQGLEGVLIGAVENNARERKVPVVVLHGVDLVRHGHGYRDGPHGEFIKWIR